MAQAYRKNKIGRLSGRGLLRSAREVAVIILALVALFTALALFTYHPDDPGWSQSVSGDEVRNGGGIVGAYIADVLLSVFGWFSYLFPVVFAFDGWRIFRSERDETLLGRFLPAVRVLGFALLFAGGCALAGLRLGDGASLPEQISGVGGILGAALSEFLLQAFGYPGSVLLGLAIFLIGVTLYTGLSWLWLLENTGRIALNMGAAGAAIIGLSGRAVTRRREEQEQETPLEQEWEGAAERMPHIGPDIDPLESDEPVEAERVEPALFSPPEAPAPPPEEAPEPPEEEVVVLVSPPEEAPASPSEAPEPPLEVPASPLEAPEPPPEAPALPSLSLLDPPKPAAGNYSREALEAMSRQVEAKLMEFNIEVKVVAVNPGPVITRLELELAPGVKGKQINNLAVDLARSLSVVSVRVVDVIPGKSVIGLEIPNEFRERVSLGELLNSEAYEKMQVSTALALGKDISGQPVVTDLSKMPHLLMAGTTGSGKSVAINAIIMSLLYKSTARDIRLIMIDPKIVELSAYEGIPHLLAPVVTDMKEAANALRWCLAEMERRYRLMAALGVKNLKSYNEKVDAAAAAGQPLPDPLLSPNGAEESASAPALDKLPAIVIIIDELADLMMSVRKPVEELIARLAQKARAANIHLILATQRPSVDVITGLIKANIPGRVAFRVSSQYDSKTILDQGGAESLLGQGDMLFLPPGASALERVHGAFVDEHEVRKVVEDIKSRGEPEYLDEVIKGVEPGAAPTVPGLEPEDDDQADPLYDEAARIVTETRKTSISHLQRRLKIGYNRAANLVEEMESAGLVGPLEANGNREILASPPPPVD